MNLALICVGGGRGERFGADKLVQALGDRSVFEVAVIALRAAYPAAPLVVVTPQNGLERWRDRLQISFPDALVVAGGDRRQDSVRAGVEAAQSGGATVVAVHDAARPLVHPEDVKRVVQALGSAPGAVLCSRVADTVKRVAADGTVLGTISRDDLRLSQTPQVFRVEALTRAWNRLGSSREWTDEAALLEANGELVHAVDALHANPKLTTAGDLVLLRAILESRA
jgi:2-C-methyl-D-erythritol 4-phosphate cytidylyltransferase